MNTEYEEPEELSKPLHVRKPGKGMEKTEEKKSGKKEDIKRDLNKTKEKASDTKEDVKEGLNEAKEEVVEQKEDLEKESKKEGMTPAEKVLKDIRARFMEGAESLSNYASENKSEKPAKNPLVDVLEDNTTITLIIDLPNIDKEDIEIGISKNSVDIQANFDEKPEDDERNFLQKERNYGTVHRTIKLNKEIKVKESKAKYENCTLTLTLPKTSEDITKMTID